MGMWDVEGEIPLALAHGGWRGAAYTIVGWLHTMVRLRTATLVLLLRWGIGGGKTHHFARISINVDHNIDR